MIAARSFLARIALVAGILALPRASAGLGVVWETQAVRYPARPADLMPEPPYVPAAVPEVRAEVEVGPGKAAAIWLDSAEILRVRALSHTDEPLRFGRLAGTNTTRTVLDEPGVWPYMSSERDTWYLVQPPGASSLWYVWARVPTRVVVERPVTRTGRLIWEVVRDDVLAWIDHGGPMPEIPVAPDSDACEVTLRTDEAIAHALIRAYPTSPEVAAALAEWRKASALIALDAVRPVLRPYMVRTRIDGTWPGLGRAITLHKGADDSEVVSREPYYPVEASNATWEFSAEGPGILAIEARARIDAPPGDEPEDELRLELASGGAVLAFERGPKAPAMVGTRPRAHLAVPSEVPLMAGSSRVSLKRQLVVPLLAGTHRYRFKLTGGPALIRADIMRRQARLLETLQGQSAPEDFIRRAEEHLAGMGEAHAPAAALIRVLLDEMKVPLPGIDEQAMRLPPLLTLVALRSQTRRHRPGASESRMLAERWLGLLGQLGPRAGRGEKLLEWHLRVVFARALRRWNRPEDAVRFLEPDDDSLADAPLELGGALGHLLIEPPRPKPSEALHLAEDAWRERTAHPDRRRDFLLVWHRKTQWSLMTPEAGENGAAPGAAGGSAADGSAAGVSAAGVSAAGGSAAGGSAAGVSIDPWTWLDTRASASGCSASGHFASMAARRGSELVHVPLATECKLEVPSLASDPGRPARLRVHLITPNDQPGPISVRIGDATWHTLAFERLESMEIAVAPGTYPVRVDGPRGTPNDTIVLFELPSAFDRLQRSGTPIRRRWPVPSDASRLRYDVPAAGRGDPIRIELREVVPAGSVPDQAPVSLRLRTDVDWQMSIRFTPGPVDPALVPLNAPSAVTLPVHFVIWLPPEASQIWLESNSGRRIVAAISLRRPSLFESNEEASLYDDDLFAQSDRARAAARQEASEACTTRPGSGPENQPPDDQPPDSRLIARVYRLSRCLVTAPDTAPWRLERGELLLDLGRGDYARADLEAVAALEPDPERAWYSDYRALESRLLDWRRMSHLRPQPHPELFARPTPLAPSLLALDQPAERLLPWVDVVRRARTQGAESALFTPSPAGDALEAYVHARLERMAGHRIQAARTLVHAYLATGTWQLGLDALVDLNELLQGPAAEPASGIASLAHGLASRLGNMVEHVEVRRAIALAEARSRRQTVRGVDSHGGFESLYLDPARLDVDVRALVPWAWLAPPWAESESRLLRPGQGARASFRLVQPASVWAEVWCRNQRSEPHPCRIVAWIDQRERLDAAAGQRATPIALPPVRLGPGDHVMEVVLDDTEPGVVASVRFMADRSLGETMGAATGKDSSSHSPSERAPVRAPGRSPDVAPDLAPGPAMPGIAMAFRQPSRAYLARDKAPITLTLSGPIVLWVEARTLTRAPAATAVLTATPLSGGPPVHETIALDPQPDPAVSSDPTRGIQVSRATETVLLLTRPGIHRVTLSASSGMVVARLAIRHDIEGNAEPPIDPLLARTTDPDLGRPGSQDELLSMRSRSFAMVLDVQPPPPRPWGSFTYSVEAGIGHDDAGTGDAPVEGGPRTDLALLLRQRTRPGRLWLGADIWLRSRLDGALAGGISPAMHVRGLPWRLRVDTKAELAAQHTMAGWAWSGRARLTLDRTFSLTPLLLAIPALGVDLRHYSLARAPGTDELDPRVFTLYGRDHSRAIAPRATLYWQPLQDQLGLVSAEARSNADLASLDVLALRGAWRGLVETRPRTGPVLELSYRVGWRFADDHRQDGYLRHDPGLSLEWPLWRGPRGRLLLDLRLYAYLAQGARDQHHFRIGLRYDWTQGRGLVDLFPKELDFDDYEEPRLWSPPP